jgi:hypothetical protein
MSFTRGAARRSLLVAASAWVCMGAARAQALAADLWC